MHFSIFPHKLFSFFRPMPLPDSTTLYSTHDQENKIVQTPGSDEIRYRLYQLVGPAGIRGCVMVPVMMRTEGPEGYDRFLLNVNLFEAPIKAIDRFLRKSKLRYKLLTDFTYRSLEECRAEIREMVECM